jgi:exodeoxyribonuclease VII large subunit
MNITQDIYTVSQLNSTVRCLLEHHLTIVWVEGEISNFAAPHSGHWYFTLKDAAAQVRCAMFRANQRHLGFSIKDGMHVLMKARVSLYENRGEFQLIAEEIEERGEGKLRRAFEMLKKKLEAVGWFDMIHKKPLPLFPTQIGIITSPTGAAIRDILHVLNRRYPCAPIIIYPTLVQGGRAASHIAQAIQIANERQECDILILARGGGSLEDLWPFNEENVAEAIYHSKIPIISGVGHEIDFTIADFVADHRAPTPSAAAEIITPDQTELLALFFRHKQQINRKMHHILITFKQKLLWVQKHLTQQDPKRHLREKMQRIDFCELTLMQLQSRLLTQLRNNIMSIQNKLYLQSPLYHLRILRHQLNTLNISLPIVFHHFLKQQSMQVVKMADKLHALSPIATLQRGYAIAMNAYGSILQDAYLIKQDDEITVKLHNGILNCIVKKIEMK